MIETQKSVLKIVEAEKQKEVAEILKEQEKEIETYVAQRLDSVLSLIAGEHQRLGLGDIRRVERMRTPDEEKADSIIPKQVFPPRIPREEWSKEDKQKFRDNIVLTALFWINGRRSLLEIVNMVEQEFVPHIYEDRPYYRTI